MEVTDDFLIACCLGQMDVVDELIDQVDPNCTATDTCLNFAHRMTNGHEVYANGRNGMMMACMSNQSWISEPCNRQFVQENPNKPWAIDVVNKLLARGADVDQEDKQGKNCLDYVLASTPFRPQLASLLRLLSKHEMNSRGFRYLVSCSSIEAAQFCVENGVDVNSSRDKSTVRDIIYLFVNHTFEDFDPIWEPYLISQGAKRYHELELP